MPPQVVDHDVHLGRRPGQALAGDGAVLIQRHDIVGAEDGQLREPFGVAAGADDVAGSEPLGHLHGHGPGAAGGPEDEDRLAGHQGDAAPQGHPSGHGRVHGGGHPDGVGLLGERDDLPVVHDALPGHRAPAVVAGHGMSDAERRPVLTPLPGKGDLGLVDALAQLTFAVQGTLGRIAADHDVSIVQARLLGILRDRRPTITELADLLQLDKSSVTKLVDRAEARGLVTRVAATADRRRVQVGLTPAGRELFDGAMAAFEAEIALLVGGLSPAQRHRLSALASLVVATDARRRGFDIFATVPPGHRPAGTPGHRPAGTPSRMR